ncbi:MAG: hypothetical protein ACLGGX_11235 [Bdellovibrionia bacterium]
MSKFVVSLFTLTVLFQGTVKAYETGEVPEDTNPKICQSLRAKAAQLCAGDADCYTASLSKLVDHYNFSSDRTGEEDQLLFCAY